MVEVNKINEYRLKKVYRLHVQLNDVLFIFLTAFHNLHYLLVRTRANTKRTSLRKIPRSLLSAKFTPVVTSQARSTTTQGAETKNMSKRSLSLSLYRESCERYR